MDYISGELLIDKVKNPSELSKEVIFTWFYNLLVQMIQYHNCYNSGIYRYLNPYSVVVTKDSDIYLLDIEAPSNRFVIKNLQTPLMREHFLKTKIQQTEENKIGYDIYCFGKTLQYVLASCDRYISLSKKEDNKCFSLIEKCINRDSKKKYLNFIQIKKDIKFTTLTRKGFSISGRKGVKILVAVILIVVLGNIIFSLGLSIVFPRSGNRASEVEIEDGIGSIEEGREEENNEDVKLESAEHDVWRGVEHEHLARQDEEIDKEDTANQEVHSIQEVEKPIEEDFSLDEFLNNIEESVNHLLDYLHNNDKEGNEKIIAHGEEIEMTILRVLAMAYDREGYKEKAILTYGRQINLENREEHLERAFIRKMRLESELGWHLEGIETGKQGLEMLGGNLNIGRLYLDILISSKLYNRSEVTREYERLLEFIEELESDEIKDRIENIEDEI
jgi:hypothetical protein